MKLYVSLFKNLHLTLYLQKTRSTPFLCLSKLLFLNLDDKAYNSLD